MNMASSAKKRSKGSKASSGKRKRRVSGTDDEEPAFLSSKYAERPTSKIYNSNFSRKDPAESLQLFRKDLISAMKLPDSEPLTPDDYWLIDDSWKPEWERGVQIPIYPDALPEPHVRVMRKKSKESTFKLPKKLLRFSRDAFFNPDIHFMSYTNTLAERTCRYDMDDVDLQWLTLVNEDREDYGLHHLEENFFEQIFEEFEAQCYANFQEAIKSEEGLGVEYDEDAICDVCRSTVYEGFLSDSSKPDSQEGNEMVFCDSCNICVHQICYGITNIPDGSWLCRTCALGIRPACVLCPNRGGAMKTTRCGQKWAHVGCAVWIPEVSFLNFVKMEPIIKISHIPSSRWALQCSVCKEKVGACIQCSEKNCKVAFHVTCAFQEGLQMRASVKLTDTDDDKLQAFCQKHSRKLRGCFSDSDEEDPLLNITRKETLTSEERANLRQQKIEAKEAEFYNYVNVDEVADMFECDRMDIEIIYNYWKLKRKANRNRALLPPKVDNNNCVEENASMGFMKKLVHRRQDLERARNLCYMTIKREKFSKRWIQYKEYIFSKQAEILSSKSSEFTEEEMKAILDANNGDMAYDKKHTGMSGPSPNVVNVLTSLVGEDYVKANFNGAVKGERKSDRMKSERTPNPYAKHYLNGLVKRSQRWFDDKQKKVSSLHSSLVVKANTNISFQSSLDHLHSDDGCDSSKDLHDLNLDSKFMSQVDPKFECFNANDNAFVNLETYHSSDAPVKEENSTEESDKRIEICFPEIHTFSLSSNDSAFASPPKHLYESLDESLSESERKIKVKSTDDTDCNDESKSCSGLENEKQNCVKKELVSPKKKNKVSSKNRKHSKRCIDGRINSSNVNSSEDASNLSYCGPVIASSSDELENEKLRLELPVENCIDVQNEDKLSSVEIADTILVPDVKPKCEKSTSVTEDKKLSDVQCVYVKSEVLTVPVKSESGPGKTKSAKVIENCDKPVKIEPTDLEEFGKINNKLVPNSAKDKDNKIRPSTNKESPLRTQSPTFKAAENGLVKGSKSNSKQSVEKSQILSKLLSKSKNINSSHPVSSPVNKQHPSSSVIKCQDKNSSSVCKSDESESSEAKDSCVETPSAAPVPRKDMLRGYKIPKKPRTEKPEENSLDLKRGNTPLSPLPDITSSSLSGYHTKAKHSWRKLEPRTKEMSCKPRTNMNGSIQKQSSERLVLKLKKDTSDPESQRWKTDPNNFNRNVGGWIGDFPLHPRLLPPHAPPPPFISHHPPRWPRMRNRGGFRPIHMTYGNGPYT